MALLSRRPGLRVLASALLVVSLAAGGRAQESSDPKPPTFRADVAYVLLDLVVRDKKGLPVVDLRPDEIQVFEDGIRRDVAALRLVKAGAEPEAAAHPEDGGTGPAAPNPTRLLSLTTLVFEPLDGPSAALARRAALQFLDQSQGDRSRVAVVRLGRGMSLVQPFTNDTDRLRAAVEMITNPSSEAQQGVLKQAQRAAAYYERVNAATTSTMGGPAPVFLAGREPGRAEEESGPCDVCPVPQDPGGAAVERKLAEVQAIALRANDVLQRQQQGESTLYPLLALLQAQEQLAGRKTVVFFSRGIAVPPNLDTLFRTTISQANRANVAIYSVDVRGLDTTRDLAAAGSALRAAAANAYIQNTRMAGAVTREDAQNFDLVDDAMRLNSAGTLRDLSESTGGLVIANSNDLGKKLEQVASDLRLYYEVSYPPSRTEYDGRFRKIEVKVARKGVSVQARSGYFALPPGGATLFPYEVPLLTALTRRPSARDFDLRPVLSLGSGDGPTIAVEVPLDGLPFVVDPKSKTYRLGLAMMAVVKSPDGQVVDRLSDDYPLTGPAAKLDEVRGKKAVLRRRVSLVPGDYVLEAVAVERASDRASVGRWHFSIPEKTEGEGDREMDAVRGAAGRNVAAASSAVSPAPEAAHAESGKGGFRDLRQAVDLYRGGDVVAAVKARTEMPLARAIDQVERLARGQGGSRAGAKDSWSDTEIQATALLQLESAVAEVQRGDPESAGRLLEQGEKVALLVDDPARRARFRREWALTAAAFYRSRYDAGNARVLLERASAAAGDDMELLFARAVIHETVGSRPFAGAGVPRLTPGEVGEAAGPELAKAEDLYRRVLATTPGQVEARLRLGRTLFLEGRRAEAVAEMDRALKSRRSNAEAHLAQLFAGAALEAAGDEDGARARYDQAQALEPRSRVAAMATARLLARTAKEGEARTTLATLVARTDDPTPMDEPWWRYRLGGFGEDSGFEERLQHLRDEVRR